MGPPRGSASPVKPVAELYGEVLLDLERPEPKPPRSSKLSCCARPIVRCRCRGLGRAYREAGDMEKAQRGLRQAGRDLAGARRSFAALQEAQAFLSGS